MDRKYPEWVFFIIAADSSGRANIMPAGWGMVCSYSPPMLAAAIRADNYSVELIREGGQFVWAFAGAPHAGLIEAVGSCSGREVDKFARFGLPIAPAAKVHPPLLADSPLQFECQMESETRSGDHVIFVGRVLACHVCDPPAAKLENFHRLYVPAKPVGDAPE